MASPRRRVVAIFVLVAAITQATNAGQYVTCRGKGFCGYQWNWGVRSRCFRCNRWINELPIPESRTDISTNPAKPSYAEANIEATLSKKYGEDSQVVQALRLAEKTHKAEKLESKPSWTQHKELSQSLAKRKKALDSVEKDIAYRKEQVAKLQKEIEEQEFAKAGILVDIAALKKQVSVSAVRAAATPSGSGRPDPKGVLEALITTLPVQKKEPSPRCSTTSWQNSSRPRRRWTRKPGPTPKKSKRHKTGSPTTWKSTRQRQGQRRQRALRKLRPCSRRPAPSSQPRLSKNPTPTSSARRTSSSPRWLSGQLSGKSKGDELPVVAHTIDTEQWVLTICQLNGSCWQTAKSVIEQTKAHLVAIQETKLAEDAQIDAASHWCIKNGWQSFWGRAVKTDKEGSSSGVAVLIRQGLGAIAPPGPQPHPSFRAGMSAAWSRSLETFASSSVLSTPRPGPT